MARRSFVTTLQQILTGGTVTLFLVATLLLAVIGNCLYDILKKLVGEDLLSLWQIEGVSVCVFVLVVCWFHRALERRIRVFGSVAGKRAPNRHKGLVLLISHNLGYKEAAEKAIAYHEPVLKQCWLLHSSAEQSEGLAKQLKRELEANGKTVDCLPVKDPLDPLEARKTVEGIYEDLPAGFTESDVILDFTGLTAAVSVGAVIGCILKRGPIQYTPSKQTDPHNSSFKVPLDPIQIDLYDSTEEVEDAALSETAAS